MENTGNVPRYERIITDRTNDTHGEPTTHAQQDNWDDDLPPEWRAGERPANEEANSAEVDVAPRAVPFVVNPPPVVVNVPPLQQPAVPGLHADRRIRFIVNGLLIAALLGGGMLLADRYQAWTRHHPSIPRLSEIHRDMLNDLLQDGNPSEIAAARSALEHQLGIENALEVFRQHTVNFLALATALVGMVVMIALGMFGRRN